jgi:hypothetical protein
MQSAAYILIEPFVLSLLVTGLLYLACSRGGRKLKNGVVLSLFAMGFGVTLLLSLLSSIMPTYVFLILSLTPLLYLNLKLGSKW